MAWISRLMHCTVVRPVVHMMPEHNNKQMWHNGAWAQCELANKSHGKANPSPEGVLPVNWSCISHGGLWKEGCGVGVCVGHNFHDCNKGDNGGSGGEGFNRFYKGVHDVHMWMY